MPKQTVNPRVYCWMPELENQELKSLSIESKYISTLYNRLTFPVTGALAIAVLAVKGESACYSPPLYSKCTLTVLWWTWIGNEGLRSVIQSCP